MSFLQRLKGRGVRSGEKLLSSDEATSLDKIVQLDVDVFQTDNMIVVYAHAAGADMSDIQVSIEGDADIVLIEGRRLRPEHIAFPKKKPDVLFLLKNVFGVISIEELFCLKVLISKMRMQRLKMVF